MSDSHQNFIKIAIEIYGLELDGDRVDTILASWLQKYDRTWILKAIVESLYRGRYKIVSVENILRDWQRLGNPRYQFTPEYEREILENIPHQPNLLSTTDGVGTIEVAEDFRSSNSIDTERAGATAQRVDPSFLSISPAVISSEDLNPEESAPFQSHRRSSSVPYSTTQVQASVSLEDRASIDNSNRDNRYAPRSLPADPGMLHRRGSYEGDRSRAKTERIVSQPASWKLFNTLKSIVDPNNHYRDDNRDSYAFPPLSVGNTMLGNIAKFKIPIETNNEGRHV
jgi:hypothetical protein